MSPQDDKLDEDLFDFPVVEFAVDADLAARHGGKGKRSKPAASKPAPAANEVDDLDLDEEDFDDSELSDVSAEDIDIELDIELGDLPDDAETDEEVDDLFGTPAAAEAEIPGAAPEFATIEASPRAESSLDATQPAAPTGPAVTGVRAVLPDSFTKILLIAAGATLVANVALVAFAWRTSASFSEGVGELGRQLSDGMHVLHQRDRVEDLERIREDANRSPVQEGDATPQPAQPTPSGEPAPTGWSDASEIELAEEEMDRGEFAIARRRLYRFLALSDGLTAANREALEARASYLIGDTLRLEGRQLQRQQADAAASQEVVR